MFTGLKDLPLDEIRSLYATGDYTQTELATKFNTHQTYISRICRQLPADAPVITRPTAEAVNRIVYHGHLDAFILHSGGRWRFDRLYKRIGAEHFLGELGLNRKTINDIFKTRSYPVIHGLTCVPNAGPLVDDDGEKLLNVWEAPKIQPAPGEWPRIRQILEHLCSHKPEAVTHLVNWLAYKVQNPAAIPRTAIVFGTSQGGGKGTLFKIMSEILGTGNCAEVDQFRLESRFNGSWGGKLLCLGNEVITADNVKDISERLKILIDSPNVEMEKKGKDSFSVPNVTAWMFATNATTGGVNIEAGDRRFNVFTNFSPITPEYHNMTISLFGPGGKGWSEGGLVEVRAFFDYLLKVAVDENAVGRPLENEERAALIEANKPLYELFKQDVEENGIDPYIQALMDKGNYDISRTKNVWDFGENGVGIEVVYQAYSHYAKSHGGHVLKLSKFKAAMLAGHPRWEWTRRNVPGTNNHQKTPVFLIKRTAVNR